MADSTRDVRGGTNRMRRVISVVIVLVGLLLWGAGILRYFAARDQQVRDQEARDRHWKMVQHEAAQRRILPGEERPVPAELPGLTGILGLIGTGVIVSIGGFVVLVKWKTVADRNRQS